MILVRVGEHEAEKVAALLDQIADVGKDEIDAGKVVAGERDAEIDRDPLPAALVAEAVEREIHADLADPPSGAKTSSSPRPAITSHRFVAAACTRWHDQFDHVAGGDRLAAAVRQDAAPGGRCRRASRSVPRHSRSASRTRIVSPRPAARASQSVRMVAKCSPRFHCASRPSILTDSAANSVAAETSAPAAARSVAG